MDKSVAKEMIIKTVRKESGFSQVYNKTFEDRNISFKARGILAYLLTRPPGWVVRKKDLINRSARDGRDSVMTGLRELRAAGYAKMETLQDPDTGRLIGKVWTIYEECRQTDFPSDGFPVRRRTRLLNNNKQLITKNPPNPPKGGMGLVSGDLVEGKLYKACLQFRQFAQDRYGAKVTDYIVQKRWITTAQSYISQQLDGQSPRFLKLLQWYQENVARNNFLTECQSLPDFCRKFHQIEKAKHRQEGDSVNSAGVEKVNTGPVHKCRGVSRNEAEEW